MLLDIINVIPSYNTYIKMQIYAFGVDGTKNWN